MKGHRGTLASRLQDSHDWGADKITERNFFIHRDETTSQACGSDGGGEGFNGFVTWLFLLWSSKSTPFFLPTETAKCPHNMRKK